MKITIYILLAIIILPFTGCSFQVKNTEGLRLAYQDIDLATSKGIELKTLENVDAKQRKEAENLYREIKAEINSYLQQAITDAADYTVNNPKESYIAIDANEKVLSFKSMVDRLGTRFPRNQAMLNQFHAKYSTKDFPIFGASDLAITVINTILELHNQNQKAAYERFKETVNKYMMKDYTEL